MHAFNSVTTFIPFPLSAVWRVQRGFLLLSIELEQYYGVESVQVADTAHITVVSFFLVVVHFYNLLNKWIEYSCTECENCLLSDFSIRDNDFNHCLNCYFSFLFGLTWFYSIFLCRSLLNCSLELKHLFAKYNFYTHGQVYKCVVFKCLLINVSYIESNVFYQMNVE